MTDAAGRDVAAALDELYQVPPAEFIVRRDRLAAELRAAGLRKEAAEVKRRRRPSSAAWAVNRLHEKHPETLARLRAAGDRERELLREGARPEEHQAARDERRAAVAAAREHGLAILRAQGSLTETVAGRLGRTLEALAVYGSLLPDPGPGRLDRELDPPGFELLAKLELPTRRRSARPARTTKPAPAARRRPARKAGAAPSAAARAAARSAERDVAAARRALDRAVKSAETADRRLEELRRRVESEARTAAERHRAVTNTRRKLEQAELRLARARRDPAS